jgi:hypothetical protein
VSDRRQPPQTKRIDPVRQRLHPARSTDLKLQTAKGVLQSSLWLGCGHWLVAEKLCHLAAVF